MTNVGIYLVTETSTGRPYIGQSRGLKKREREHRTGQFPAAAFSFEVLLHCAPDLLDFFERAFILGYDSITGGFNKTVGGYAYAKLLTEEQRERRSRQQKEGRGYIPTRKGAVLSEETKAKMRAAKLGKKMSPEAIENMRKAKTGRPCPPFTEEHRARLSAAAKERYARERAEKGVTDGEN